MSNIRNTAPKGLDREIDILQCRIYNYLVAKGWTYYDCYPRCYVNSKDDKVNKIEFALNNKDYKEVLFNDKINASSFFVLTKSDKGGLRKEKANLSLIFQINLKKIKPAITTRLSDEDIVNEILQILFKQPYNIKNVGIKKGVNDVYSDLKVVMNAKNEIGEFFVCRFDMELHYTLNEAGIITNQII